MATRIRTIDFLPEIFQTNTNDQFLSATLDQLIQPPDFRQVQGYIGSKFGYGVKTADRYVQEPSTDKTNYQLEPTVVFTDAATGKINDAITYPGIIEAIKLESGIELNHNTLFNNEFYSWDSFVDLDKIINFGQYYWLPEGPESVDIANQTVLQNATIKIISNVNTYQFEVNGELLPTENPTLTLVRGGSYRFEYDTTASGKFWIQSLPGVNGVDPNRTNFSTRDINGVEFYGPEASYFTYTVPTVDAQDNFKFPGLIPVDLVTTLSFDKLNGMPFNQIKNIDGVVDVTGKTLLFYGSDPDSRAKVGDFFDSAVFDNIGGNTPGFEGYENEAVTGTVFTISLIGEADNPIIKLTPTVAIADNTTIKINSGVEYINKTFVKNSYGEVILIPSDTASLSTLYYQDATNTLKFGKITLIDKPTESIINIFDILGKQSYTSPNNIKFSNGLRVKFVGFVYPISYLNDTYYVEGVGTSIQLIPASELIVPELYSQGFSAPFDESGSAFDQKGFSDVINLPYTPDYITINRSSIDRNGWSRGNRWFHVDVLTTISENNTLTPIIDKALINGSGRALRPIVEFYPNLKLIYHGSFGKKPVDYIDTTTYDALTDVNGTNLNEYLPDGENSNLSDGTRIVFANDSDPEVRNKIFVASIAIVNGNRVITLAKASDGDVDINDQIVIVNGTTNKGYNYYYNGYGWIVSQTKITVNQKPLFDLFDSYGISFSDSEYYTGTDFKGCTLFQYKIGSGITDTVLGIPIQYSGVGNLNDINFEATLNSDIFNYVSNNVSISQLVGYGYVYQYNNKSDFSRKLGWQTAVDTSFQYQVFNYEYFNTNTTNSFTIDIPIKDSTSTKWPTSVVYVNNGRINTYTAIINGTETKIEISSTLVAGDIITIMVYSDSISKTGYYQVPSNLQQNPFNYQIDTINAGDIRGHYKSICNNIPGLVGNAFGSNNYRDLGNPVPYGTRIVQHSATMITPAIFIRRQETNFFNSINYNATEYVKFKSLLVNTANSQDYTPYDSPGDILDDVLDIISSTKSQSGPFFWSDMLPSKTPHVTNSYTFAIGISKTVYPLTQVYDFTVAGYNSVLVYVSKVLNGVVRFKQLLKDVDYFVDNSQPYVLITAMLDDGDVVTVKEYTQTYGSYVPNTPTKMGLYPKFIPEIVLDETYLNPTYFIKGHDGSLTKLYGEFDEYGKLIDFRDKVLYEFECRIYNNLKVNAKIPLEYADVFPGQFRTTEYTTDQLSRLYTTSFLNWVGLNRVDTGSQYYDSTDEYTWNYSKALNKLDKKPFAQGNWRGIYMWVYDTATPHATPWEMLGLPVQPVWWEERYGIAPYTSDNSLLWNDLRDGYIWNNGDPYVNSNYARPELMSVLPVNTKGELLSPFEVLVQNYNNKTFNADWVIGDMGPAEYSYRKSSTWPFDLMRMFALTKPAQFFTLGLDLDVYKYNYEFKQYLKYNRLRTTSREPSDLYGHDEYSAKHSYVNWIIDYLNQYGLPGTTITENLITYVDVRLSYRMSGYTDKNKINFYIEKGSPNSTNSSLMIPDDSYEILQYNNEPNDSIVYSSVIVQKVIDGYKVYGNSQSKTYFTYNKPSPKARQKLITVIDTQVYIPTDFSTNIEYISYGHTFKNVTTLANFLAGYGDYLISQGVVFDDVENNTPVNWDQMIAELLYWINTGWEVGSVINLNPCANSFHVEKDIGIIQPFTFYQNNFVLNQNLIPVNSNDLAIYRSGTTFKLKILSNGDTISYLRADTSIAEHIVIFNNETVFNDIVYNIVTGLRQQRLYLKGYKTNQWDGTLYAPGFIQNQNNVTEWKENVKYNKGTIVLYKRKYWMANKTVIIPSSTFDYNDWLLTSYDKIGTGILANPSTRASESEYYYDIHRSNIQNDGDLLGFSLIGYRPRSYLANADLDDVAQVNIYKDMIAQKGTLEMANNFQGATIQKTDLSYNIYENWAIKSTEYGGVLNHNFIEVTLDENLLTGNPAILSIINGNNVDVAQQQIPLYNIKNYGRTIGTANILPTVSDSAITDLPSAGYANLDDMILYAYTVERISDTLVNAAYKNDYIWIADKQSDWGVYTPTSLKNQLVSLINNLNDTCTLTFAEPHNLVQYDTIAIIYSDSYSSTNINGFYVVESILSNNSIAVNLSLPSTTANINFSQAGLLYKFVNMRVTSPTKMNALPLDTFEYETTKVWVDHTSNNNWAVYQKNINYNDIGFDIFDINNKGLGSAVAYMPPLGYYVSDPGLGKVYKYIRSGTGDLKTDTITHGVGYGTAMARNSEFMIISEPSDTVSKLYIYRIVALPEVEALVEEQVLTVSGTYVGTSMAFSGDSTYLFVGAPKINSIFYFQRQVDYTTLPAAVSNSGLLNIGSVTANSPTTGTMKVSFAGTSSALKSELDVGSTVKIEGFVPAITSTKSTINGTHVVTGITTKPGDVNRVIAIEFAMTGTWSIGSNGSYGVVLYNPKPEIGQLITTTNPLDKFFIVKGNAVSAIPAGKRITFLQYKQFGTSVLNTFGYEAQVGYTLAQAKAATVNPANNIFGTDRRKYYVVLTGNIPVDTHFSLDPSTDNKDYIVKTSNSTYSSGSNTTKVYINEFFAGIIYAQLFIALDQYALTSFTLSSSTAKVYTYTNLLPTYLTVLTGEYDATTDTTKMHTVERIGYSISPTRLPSLESNPGGSPEKYVYDTYINTVNNQFNFINYFSMLSYEAGLGGNLQQNPANPTDPTDTVLYQSTDNFGASIAVNHDASKIFIGSPTYHVRLSPDENVPPVPDVGVVWVFDRLIETFQVQYTPQDFEDFVVVLPWNFAPTTIVSLNGVALSRTQYGIIAGIAIQLGVRVKAGDIVTVSSPNLVLMQVMTSYEDINGVIPSQQFGTSIATNTTGSEVLIGSPYDHTVEGQDGAVYRFTNEAKRYGFATGLIPAYVEHINNDVTYLFINGYSVYLDISVDRGARQIAEAINLTQITNVFAYVTEDNRLVIRLINVDLGSDNNKLNITAFNGNYFYQLGISPYTKTQVIREPHAQHNSKFGYRIAFNEKNSFVVTAPQANRYAGTFFDKYNTNIHYNTVFDLNLTTFEDMFYNAGAAYMYDYIKPYNESLLNSGEYIYAQPVNDSALVYGAQPLYGNSVSFNDNIVMVGSPGYKADTIGGKINVFENISGNQNWSIYRNNNGVVDIDQIQRVQLYNNLTDENLVSLDYIDPLRGKLLGVVRENIDFIGTNDPAGYSNGNITSTGMIWSEKQIGKIWFNTNTIKFLNYHQNDLAYNARYWGSVFPGSTVTVYTWIESDVSPAYYTGSGTVYNFQSYTTKYVTNANDGLVQKYYYWVRNTNTLYNGKTLSDTVLERYITSPQNSGIAYMAPLRADTYGLYNVHEYINGVHTNLHLGFSIGKKQSATRNEFKLIQNNSSDDFLPGLPNYALGHINPDGLYNRLLESFAGIDESGASVPNYTLPAYLQTGISVRPSQSMFVNRFNALKNYLEYANSVLIQYPINEFSNLTYLSATGAYFDASRYWSNTYWWATGYNNKTKTKVEVGMYADLYKLDAIEGLIVGVARNGQGKREVYLYTNDAWSRIGLQNGTIQFSNVLWDYQSYKIGFGDNFFDTVSFDTFPAVETYYIIRALNEQIFTGPLLEHRNKSLILMFEYIQSENTDANNYLPWLNKTSFADVTYTVRDLTQDVNYHQDNITLLTGYINEVKPYHTVIKDFDLRYTSSDTLQSGVTDFDVSPVYDSLTNKFISPKLNFNNTNRLRNEYALGDDIWYNSNYTNWYNNFGLALNGIPNFEIGILKRYMTPTSNTLLIDNARGMPDQGMLYIDDEIIGYTGVDRETGLVSGLTRGIGNSLVSKHFPDTTIITDLPGVVVLDTGRDYIDPPSVTAYIDTTIYPAPTREAVLQPVMSGGKVIAINILDPGENYPVTPEIIFSSSYDVSFAQTSLNFVNDTILIPSTTLNTGDLIKSTCIDGKGSITDGYYYVYVIAQIEGEEIISITLHKTLTASLIGRNKIKLNPGTINLGVTGTNYIFSLTARAIGITTNLNIRSILNTIRFDRTSYIPKVVPWQPNQFWGSRYTQNGLDNINSASSDVSLYYGRAYTGLTGTVTNPSNSIGTGATFTVTNVLLGGEYRATLTNGGSNYGVFDTITISGASLSGVTPTHDCFIDVSTVSSYYRDLLQDTTTGSGTDARFNITVNAYSQELTGTLTVENGNVTVTGTGTLFYTEVSQGSILYINGVQCIVATVPANVPSDPDYNIKLTLTTSYTGTSGTYNARVAVSEYVAEIDSVFYPGTGYAVDDTIKITGDRLNGSTPANDLTIHVEEVDGSGKILNASAVVGLGYGTAVIKGSIKTFTVRGEALDSNFASLQGAVLPIKSMSNDNGVTSDLSGNVIVRLDYHPSLLNPGQIQGAKTYFYHNSSPYVYVDAIDGTRIEIYRPRFNPYDVSYNYFIKIINAGSAHYVGERIIISGSVFSSPSAAGANDVTITINQIGNTVVDDDYGFIGSIVSATVTGTSARVFDVYYVQPITTTTVQVFSDPGMKRPVKLVDFLYTHNVDLVDPTPNDNEQTLLDYNTDVMHISDFVYVPEPFSLGLSYKYDFNSMVTYNNIVWRCTESNNDSEFDASKWTPLQSDDRSMNALDRIVAYYEPAINMPAKDLQQLVSGISYPGNVYYGNSFSPEDIIPLDVALQGLSFFPRTLSIKGIVTGKSQLTGSLSVRNGSSSVTGNGTLFIKELSYNAKIYINDVEYVVDNIANNYSISLTSPYIGPDIDVIDAYKFQYVAIGESTEHSLLLTSIDGVTWNNHVLAENTLGVTDILHDNDQYLVSTLSKNNPMLLSYNGVDWLGQGQSTLLDQLGFDDSNFDSSPQTYPEDSVRKIMRGTDGMYYGVGTIITRSVNGVIWDKQFDFGTKTINIIYNIAEVNTNTFRGFIAVGGGNQIISGIDTAAPNVSTASIILTSLNGSGWELHKPQLTNKTLKVIISNSTTIVTAGDSGEIWYGINGNNWTAGIIAGPSISYNLNAGIYANGKFVIVGNYGTILTSTDGINWVQRTNNLLTIDNLNDITYDGLYYYVVGDNAAIIRSSDTITWTNASSLTPAVPESVVTGNDFLYGHGPEELVAGIMTDSLSIKVMTTPGANWDATSNIPQSFYYQNTSFGMKSVISETNTVSFAKLLKNPAEVSVFLLDDTTLLGNRIYTGYTVNWITKVVTLTDSLPANKVLMVEVYEVGNGKQKSRSNSQVIPLRLNEYTGFSEIVLQQIYEPVLNNPVVYHNGTKLIFQTDYDISYGAEGLSTTTIQFNAEYQSSTDYVTWALLDSSIGDFQPTEIMYSIPETQQFTGNTSKIKTLTNYVGGVNDINAIVEKNGIRLTPTTDYTINAVAGTLTLVSDILTSDVIAVTTFNETDRLFLETIVYTATAGQTVFEIPQVIDNPIVDNIYYKDVNKVWVTINGNRIDSSKLSYDNLNNLTIDASISAGDVVVVTVTIDGDTPNSTMFNIDVDKYGNQIVLRSNPTDSTWLTQDFNVGDDKIHVNDVNMLIDIITQDTTAILVDSMLLAYINCDVSAVRLLTVYNQTTSANVTGYTLEIINGRPCVVLDITEVDSEDSVTVTLKIGNTIELNGEKIRFTTVDFVANTVSGLTRGVLGTSPVLTNLKYDSIYGITKNRTLDPVYYGVIWNSSNNGAGFADPLQVSTTPAANFLRYGYY